MSSKNEGSFGSALVTTTVLSIVLCPLLVIGPFIAGFIGRKKLGGKGAVIGQALLPGLLWAIGIYFVMNHEWKIGKQLITPAATGLSSLAWATVLSIVGGAIAASKSKGTLLIGLMSLLVSIGIVALPTKKLIDLYGEFKPDNSGPVVNADVVNGCSDRLKKLYSAIQNYAQSYDDTLPPADKWTTAITDPSQSYVAKEQSNWLDCPANGKFGFAMNDALSGKKLKDVADKEKTPLLYESASRNVDAHGNMTDAPNPGRHGGKNNILYMDGSVKAQ